MENNTIDKNYPELLHSLMGDELYFITEHTHYEAIESEGENKFRFLNIFKHSEKGYIPEQQRDFFFKVINNIKTDRFDMALDGLAAINIQEYPGVQWDNLDKLFSPKFCILWDVEPTALGIAVNRYTGIEHNGCRIIYVDSLANIEASLELRQRLWKLIKNLFSIK
ncbi:MAG: hypothetical protein H7321_04800 [Bacteroidia bacterium]|nr:hypothetical protein [Bacteroidia bacterium]